MVESHCCAKPKDVLLGLIGSRTVEQLVHTEGGRQARAMEERAMQLQTKGTPYVTRPVYQLDQQKHIACSGTTLHNGDFDTMTRNREERICKHTSHHSSRHIYMYAQSIGLVCVFLFIKVTCKIDIGKLA